MLRAFKNVGYLNLTMLKEDLGQADRRIKNFTRDGYIEKVSYLNKKTKNAEFAYRLTDKGKTLCTNNVSVNSFYKSSSVNHDLGLANIYFSLEQENRDNWITENEWRDIFKEHIEKLDFTERDRYREMLENRQISPADGGYIDRTGNLVAVEIITSSYRQNDIQAKEVFAETLNAEYNQYRA